MSTYRTIPAAYAAPIIDKGPREKISKWNSNKYEVDPPRLVLGSWKHKNTSKRKEKNKTKNKQTKQQRG